VPPCIAAPKGYLPPKPTSPTPKPQNLHWQKLPKGGHRCRFRVPNLAPLRTEGRCGWWPKSSTRYHQAAVQTCTRHGGALLILAQSTKTQHACPNRLLYTPSQSGHTALRAATARQCRYLPCRLRRSRPAVGSQVSACAPGRPSLRPHTRQPPAAPARCQAAGRPPAAPAAPGRGTAAPAAPRPTP
jgi:hypothetical protein